MVLLCLFSKKTKVLSTCLRYINLDLNLPRLLKCRKYVGKNLTKNEPDANPSIYIILVELNWIILKSYMKV